MRPRGLLIYLTVNGSDDHVQILSDAVLLEGVPTGVTKVSNKVECLFQVTP
jgi:hypothetical protein